MCKEAFARGLYAKLCTLICVSVTDTQSKEAVQKCARWYLHAGVGLCTPGCTHVEVCKALHTKQCVHTGV